MTRLDRRALFATGSAAALLSAAGISSAETPKRGGHLRVAVADQAMLDLLLRHAVFNALVEIAPDGTLRGELATSWRPLDNGCVWAFELRPDARFHDGRRCRAADVAASLLLHPAVEHIDTRGGVTIRLHAPDADFPLTLANCPIHPADDIDGHVGTGLYELTHHRPGRQWSARRVAPHFKDGAAGWAERLDVICLPDAQARAEAVQDGHVDVAVVEDAPDGIRTMTSADLLLAIRDGVACPDRIGQHAPLDDGRLPERWWLRG